MLTAEEKLGQAPTVVEIFVEIKTANPQAPVNNIFEGAAVLTTLFREDLIYADNSCEHYSAKRQEGYKNYSELFRQKVGFDYGIGPDGSVVSKTAKLVNFKQMIEILKSKDESLLEQNKWIWDGDFRFFDGEPLPTKIAFNTYPRSGNSMFRRYLEQLTGVSTGSTVHLHTATSLQIQGLRGEGIIDDRAWIIKAHHPMLLPEATKFKSDKIICCIRNPLDVLPSFASLSNTLSHSGMPEYEYERDFPEWWDWWVHEKGSDITQYFDTMLKHVHEDKLNPIYIVRFEDLIRDPEPELIGAMKYLLDMDDLTGTNVERQIKALCANKSKAGAVYKLKKTTG